MISLRNIKIQAITFGLAVTFALAGAISASSVLGPSTASADSCTGSTTIVAVEPSSGHPAEAITVTENLAPNPSFEHSGQDFEWVRNAKGTDARLGRTRGLAEDGSRAVYVYASKSANQGWPGFETKEIIPVDPTKEYTFSASYFAPAGRQGMPWLDIALFNSRGKHVGSVSTGSSPVLEDPNEWHKTAYNFKPAVLKKRFGDIAGVKLGLKLSLNYRATGIEHGKATALAYDNVKFEAVD